MSCATRFAFSFTYKVQFENGLTEHEFDHVYIGVSEDVPVPEKSEVQSWKYISLPELEKDILLHPELYTEWMKICLPRISQHLNIIHS